MLFTRRRWLTWTPAGTVFCFAGRSVAFASDFWDQKSPSAWSSDEVHQLLTKSPWAKQVVADAPAAGNENRNGTGAVPGPANTRYGDLTGPGEAGQVNGRARDLSSNKGDEIGTGRGPARGPSQQFKGMVRWESAKPLLDATKTSLPDRFDKHYVVSVSEFPFGEFISASGIPKFSDSTMEHIMLASSLTSKRNNMVQAQVVQVVGRAVLLGFSKESIHLSRDDKEIVFATLISRMAIKTRFNLREMMYRGALAI